MLGSIALHGLTVGKSAARLGSIDAQTVRAVHATLFHSISLPVHREEELVALQEKIKVAAGERRIGAAMPSGWALC